MSIKGKKSYSSNPFVEGNERQFLILRLKNKMKYFLLAIFISMPIVGHGQKVKLGFRSGVSFSNFYAHKSPGEIPSSTITTNPLDPTIILEPNLRDPPSYYYETDFFQNMRIGFFSYLYMSYEIKQRLSTEIGLGYTQRGINIQYSRHSTSINSSNNIVKLSYQFNRNLRLDYISIPLTFQYKLDRKEYFYISAGIYNAVAINFLNKESSVTTKRQTFDLTGRHT